MTKLHPFSPYNNWYRYQATQNLTLPETNMETQKGPYEDYSPSKRGYMGFHVTLGECKF